tara:strand:- start:528 stop:962 length:435 start_codon:yes stop_codon:yes gene_type:complete
MIKNNTDQFKIILEYIKDLSIETPSVSALSFVKENISNYNMDIDIASMVLPSKALEITTKLTLQDKKDNNEKAFFEIKYATVISLDRNINDKNAIGKIVLCDLQKIIYPKIQNIFLNIIKNAGYPEIKFEKDVDFEKLYSEKFN